MPEKKICFIINPKSGVTQKHGIVDLIHRLIDKNIYTHEVVFTQAPKHATALSREAAGNKYDVVVAVGGDGSVNEVAKGLIDSNTALAFIAAGSGNGMARHLRIPMDFEKALHVINTGKVIPIDTLRANDEFCTGTIGVGFDAHVAHLFSQSPKRGYSTYVKLVLTEFYKYKPQMRELLVDDKQVTKECFLLTFANSSQFGNNAVIAPFADVTDGIIDISMMKKFMLAHAPHLIYRLMHNKIHESKYFEMMTAKNIVLKNNGTLKAHIDGEPVTFSTDVHVKVVAKSLNVLVPNN